MKIKKTGKRKYPLKVYPSKGHAFYVPSQHKFGSDFVSHHGCSLVGFYIAMSFIGKKKGMGKLLKWSKKHLSVKSKIPIDEVYKGIRKLAPKANVSYRRKVTVQEVRTALARGYLVLLETKDPIHTNPIMWDDTKKCVRNFSHGGKEKISIGNYVKKQCTSDAYRGCIFIRP